MLASFSVTSFLDDTDQCIKAMIRLHLRFGQLGKSFFISDLCVYYELNLSLQEPKSLVSFAHLRIKFLVSFAHLRIEFLVPVPHLRIESLVTLHLRIDDHIDLLILLAAVPARSQPRPNHQSGNPFETIKSLLRSHFLFPYLRGQPQDEQAYHLVTPLS